MSVERILALGDDQLTSQFILEFPGGIPGGGDPVSLALRMKDQLDPPEEAVSTYDTFFRGLLIKQTGGLEETDKTLQLSIRIDQRWKQYDDLRRWKERVFNTETGQVGSNSVNRTTMAISAMDRDNVIVHRVIFTAVKIFKLKISEWNWGSGDPMFADAGFIYGRVKVQ